MIHVSENAAMPASDSFAPRLVRTVGIVLLVFIGLAAVYGFWSGAFVPPSWLPRAQALFVTQNEKQPLRMTGEVVSREVVISATVGGLLQSLLVDEGSQVREGDLIAEFDKRQVRAEYAQHEAAIAQLHARLQQAQETLRLEDDRSRQQFTYGAAQVDVAKGELARAEAQLIQARREAERAQSLSNAGILSRSELERANTDVEVAGAQVKALSDKVKAAEVDVDVRRANLRQASVVAADLRAVEAQLEQAQAQLLQTRVRLEDLSIRAPISGTISVRVASPGEVIRAGDPIVTIVDLDNIWVKVDVDESFVSRLSTGDSLKVRLASGEVVDGTVINIAPEGDFAIRRDVNRVKRDIKTFSVRIKVPNPDHRIHAGMSAYILMDDGKDAPSLQPRAAETAEEKLRRQVLTE